MFAILSCQNGTIYCNYNLDIFPWNFCAGESAVAESIPLNIVPLSFQKDKNILNYWY